MRILTTRGEMDADLLRKEEKQIVIANKVAEVTEYYFGDELVHRSAVTRLTGLQAKGVAREL